MKTNLIFNSKLIFFCMLLMMSNCIYSKELGTMGETYPIIEIDFLEFIQMKLEHLKTSGAWADIENKTKREAKRYRDRPPRLDGVTKAKQTTTRKFDPTLVLDRDLKTTDGRLVAVKGTAINPLNYISLSKALIFFDGDDSDQVVWAENENKKRNGKTKLILVNGSLLKMEKHFKKQVYFDQTGALVKRFKLRVVPSSIVQEKDYLLITEYVI